MLAEIYGKASGCSGGRGGSMHLVDNKVGFVGSTAIVGNSIPIGVGLGLSLQLEKSSALSAVFCGDGSVKEECFMNLPILQLFVNCQCFLYVKIIYTPFIRIYVLVNQEAAKYIKWLRL